MKRRRIRDWVEATRILAFPPSVVQMGVMAAALGWRHGGCDWTNIVPSAMLQLAFGALFAVSFLFAALAR